MTNSNKVAILISGAYRTFDKTWPNNKKILEKLGYEYDIFFHSWDNNYNTKKSYRSNDNLYFGLGHFRPVKYENPDFDVINKIDKLPNQFKVKIDSYQNFIDLIENSLNLKIMDISDFHLNSLAMFYGMSEVAKMAIVEGGNYKYFLRMRPDFKLPNKFRFSKKSKLKFHGVTVMISGFQISDISFSGSFKQHICVMNSFENLIAKISNEGWINAQNGLPRGAENWFYEVLVSNNLLTKLENKFFEKKGKVIRHALIRDYETSYIEFHSAIFTRNKLRFKRIIVKHILIIKSSYTRCFKNLSA